MFASKVRPGNDIVPIKKTEFLLCADPQNDKHWFLTIRNLNFKWFNVLAFGMDEKDLGEGIEMIERIKAA